MHTVTYSAPTIPSIKFNNPENFTRKLVNSLAFRTEYESGVPVSGYAGNYFKERIRRTIIGQFSIQLYEESSLSFNGSIESKEIGGICECSCVFAYDQDSNIGIIELVIPSSGLMLSQFLDSMSRNQISIVRNNKQANNKAIQIRPTDNKKSISLYEYLQSEYGIVKTGNAKAFVNLFDDKENYSKEFLSSLLFGETFYECDEGLGRVIDKDILRHIECKFGIGQYDYASVVAYKNVLMQLSSKFKVSLDERIIRESVTLFYMELILFEEAALYDVNNNISMFLNNLYNYKSSTIMSRINTIMSNYAKTCDFWDIQMNYPSSRKSVEEIRSAFQIDKLRRNVSAKKEIILNICSIRDTILEETEGYFISILGIIIAALSCADLLDSPHIKIVLGFVVILIFIFCMIRFRMNRHLRNRRF